MYGDGVNDDVDRTAFRRAEKKYKLYYDQNSRKKKQPRPVDLSEVVDFKLILDTFNQIAETPNGFHVLEGEFDCPVVRLDNRPGFYFIPGALSVEQQCQWIKESLMSFPQPPNRTNHNAHYGPIQDLFASAREEKILVEDEHSPIESESLSNGQAQRWKFCDKMGSVSLKGYGGNSILASALLRKLRWSTLGLQFDWSKRNYDVSLPHNKIPAELCQLVKKLAVPAMPSGDVFKPEAAIVNYFASGDSLGGHLDDMELDWTKPIVSMSLGCKAIFLLGGKSRDDEPLAMFLRSGDVVLMAGEARECFHGVPRIFADREHSEIASLEKHLSTEYDRCVLDYITSSRININIRQVY
ncbi:alpha-ketoglutarate-dependent dioxygenase alkB-like [Chenopodium quinoa]|uniref:Fe2OG dioxygenase domain-containing protein n=1 Tax=Chenopodium quinoa TaxID=63459 RepID=A0A803L184_CHEQI|nr:alpha-ketoglutarate-dependent dioxygenase alkB-like [Chenopodium quinoa]